MDRTLLTVVATLALMLAVLIGWGLRWIYGLLNPPPPPEPIADSEWAEYAKAWEAQRDAALVERDAIAQDMGNQLTQMTAERDAAMDGLRDSRQAVEHLEAELATLRNGQDAPEDA